MLACPALRCAWTSHIGDPTGRADQLLLHPLPAGVKTTFTTENREARRKKCQNGYQAYLSFICELSKKLCTTAVTKYHPLLKKSFV